MDMEQLEKRLDGWKHWLLVAAGASGMLFLTTVLNPRRFDLPGILFVVLWLAVTPPGFFLLMSKKWRMVPLAKRLNIAFGFLACAWLALLAAVIGEALDGNTLCLSGVLFAVLIPALLYFYLRKKIKASEEMFP